jgi:hypothetical protein
MRWRTRVTHAVGGLAASGAIALAVAGPAPAATPVGTCADSYSPYTRAQFVGLATTRDDRKLFGQIFDVVNQNGDAVVCFKPYPNGLHGIHSGNLVDNTAAPHQ